MSGIVAAAQSSGCCCRPQEGCTCGDPNRPGAVADRSLTSVLVTSEFGIDQAVRRNSTPFDCNGCPCSGFPIYGTYGYQPSGAVIDPDVAEGNCEGRACTQGPCASCSTYSASAEIGEIVAIQDQVNPVTVWRSRITFEGENRIGQWSWAPRQVGYCNPGGNPNVRIRKFCPFFLSGEGEQFGNAIADPNGAFIDIGSGEYAGTPYGNDIGSVLAVGEAVVQGVGGGGLADPCAYLVSVRIAYISTWSLRRQLAESGTAVANGGYVALYRKPCLSPTDTVIGTYQLLYDPEYSTYAEDPDCGAIRWFDETRATVPQTLAVS